MVPAAVPPAGTHYGPASPRSPAYDKQQSTCGPKDAKNKHCWETISMEFERLSQTPPRRRWHYDAYQDMGGTMSPPRAKPANLPGPNH